MPRGGADFDPSLVTSLRRRDPPVSWQAISQMTGASTDALRRCCDKTYVPLNPADSSCTAPKLASGRECRPSTYEPSPARPDLAPPPSNAISMPSARIDPPLNERAPLPTAAPPKSRQPRSLAAHHLRHDPEPVTMPVLSRPSSRVVARAVIAAARVLGEDPTTLADVQGGQASRRYRFAAFIALQAVYPGAPTALLGRLTSIPSRPSVPANVARVRQAAWWPHLGEAAVEAALDAISL